MPAVLLGIFPGKFARGLKPFSKSVAKCNVFCSEKRQKKTIFFI